MKRIVWIFVVFLIGCEVPLSRKQNVHSESTLTREKEVYECLDPKKVIQNDFIVTSICDAIDSADSILEEKDAKFVNIIMLDSTSLDFEIFVGQSILYSLPNKLDYGCYIAFSKYIYIVQDAYYPYREKRYLGEQFNYYSNSDSIKNTLEEPVLKSDDWINIVNTGFNGTYKE